MKKVLEVLLLMVLLVQPCLADSFDLSSMSDEELAVLKEAVDIEYAMRNGEASPIFNGKYVVGKDIKAGRYLLYAIERDSYASYKVVLENGDYKDYSRVQEKTAYVFTLEEGDLFEIENMITAYLQIVPEEGASWIWAP